MTEPRLEKARYPAIATAHLEAGLALRKPAADDVFLRQVFQALPSPERRVVVLFKVG